MSYAMYYEAPFYLITFAFFIGLLWKPDMKTVLLCSPYLIMNYCMLIHGGILADEYAVSLNGYEVLVSALNFVLYIILCIRAANRYHKTSSPS